MPNRLEEMGKDPQKARDILMIQSKTNLSMKELSKKVAFILQEKESEMT